VHDRERMVRERTSEAGRGSKRGGRKKRKLGETRGLLVARDREEMLTRQVSHFLRFPALLSLLLSFLVLSSLLQSYLFLP